MHRIHIEFIQSLSRNKVKSQLYWQWAEKNRIMSSKKGNPGPFKASSTPWIKEFSEYFYNTKITRFTLVQGSQTGKTETFIGLIGYISNFTYTPLLFLGDTQENANLFVRRLEEMCQNTAGISLKKLSTYSFKVNNMQVDVGWLGSIAQLSSRPAENVYIDEIDKRPSLPKHGDTYTLAEARTDSFDYPRICAGSTPTAGEITSSKHSKTGLIHWDKPKKYVPSRIWRLFKMSSAHEFMVPCPVCNTFFSMRKSYLHWEDGSSDIAIQESAYIKCPHCDGKIEEKHKINTIENGVLIAPGQKYKNGRVVGNVNTDNFGMFISGLNSTTVSWGKRALSLYNSKNDEAKLNTLTNTGFGECYSAPSKRPNVATLKAKIRDRYTLTDDYIICAFSDIHRSNVITLVVAHDYKNNHFIVLDYIQVEGGLMDIAETIDDIYLFEYQGYSITIHGMDSGFSEGNLHSAYEFAATRPHVYLTKGSSRSMNENFRPANTHKQNSYNSTVNLWIVNTKYFKPKTFKILHGNNIVFDNDIPDKGFREFTGEYEKDGEWIETKQNHAFDCMAGCVFLSEFYQNSTPSEYESSGFRINL